MFKKNDRLLPIALAIVHAVFILSALCVIVISILTMLNGGVYITYGLLFLVICLIWVVVWWIFAQLFLILMADVKFIRNKLYDRKNHDLSAFYNAEYEERGAQKIKSATLQSNGDERANRLREWKRLLDEGIIGEEEFEEQKRKILSASN